MFYANLCYPGHRKKSEKKVSERVDSHRVLAHSVSMQNEIAILKVNKFKTVVLVSVTYRKADGTTGVSSGKTEAEAIANISKVVEVKSYDFAPLAKRSNSGSYFRNNNGKMVEI
jgi:hypothetical protein